jgi:hypothetical protein
MGTVASQRGQSFGPPPKGRSLNGWTYLHSRLHHSLLLVGYYYSWHRFWKRVGVRKSGLGLCPAHHHDQYKPTDFSRALKRAHVSSCEGKKLRVLQIYLETRSFPLGLRAKFNSFIHSFIHSCCVTAGKFGPHTIWSNSTTASHIFPFLCPNCKTI